MSVEATLNGDQRLGRTLPGERWIRARLPALALASSRLAAMAAQLAVQVAVGALSGPVGLGVLQLYTAWSTVMGELLSRGWPPTIMKHVALAWSRSRREDAQRAISNADASLRKLALPSLLAAAAVALFLAHGHPASRDSQLPLLLFGVVVGSVAFAMLRMGAEALKAMQAPLAAVTLENFSVPAALLGTCAVFWWTRWELSPLALALAGMSGFVVGAVLVRRSVRRRLGASRAVTIHQESHRQRGERRALWFGAVLAIVFLQLPFLVLPAFSDTATIGVFAVAWKLVNIITTLLLLMSSVFGPAFARAAGNADRHWLGNLLKRTQVLSIVLYAPAALLLLATADSMAQLFNVSAGTLRSFIGLLMLGQAVNAITGLSGLLLCMTGAARTEWRIGLITLGIACLTVFPAGHLFGAIGIAAWFSAVIAVKNLMSWAAARNHLKKGELRL